MAKVPFGILGAFIGKIGPVIGKTWKSIPVVTAARRPSKRDKNPTPEQDTQRTKFGFTSHFLKGLGPLVKKTFREPAIQNTEFQCAVSYNLCNAVSQDDQDFRVHYELVSLGRGTLPNAVLPEAKATGDGNLHFLWADNTGIGLAAAADTPIVVAYHAPTRRWLYKKTHEGKRADCSVDFALPALKGEAVHTWLSFVSDSGRAADSVYTGEIVLG